MRNYSIQDRSGGIEKTFFVLIKGKNTIAKIINELVIRAIIDSLDRATEKNAFYGCED